MGASAQKAWLSSYTPWTKHSLDYGTTTLINLLDEAISEYPDAHALYFFGARTTYADMGAAVQRVASGLRKLGVQRGDHVAIALPNCPQHVIAFYAVLTLGAVVVEHNPLYTAHELSHPFEDHKAKVAIVWDKIAPTFAKLKAHSDLTHIITVNMIDAMPLLNRVALSIPLPALRKKRQLLHASAPDTIAWAELDATRVIEKIDVGVKRDDPALILYTSGTTGAPKGAVLSHGNMVANCLQGQAWVPGLKRGKERFLAALPMFHAYGVTMCTTFAVSIAAEIILLPKPEIPLLMEAMKKERPTWVPAVPTLYAKVADDAEKNGKSIDGIRNAFSGAMTLSPAIVEKWERLTGGLLVEGYGLTETSPIIVGNPMSSDRRPGYVGVPFPDTTIRICNPDNPTEEMPDGTEGEVQVQGPQVFQGYLNEPEATEASFVDGWYRTGDIGVLEADGFLRLVDRIKEVIITGGFNVYPSEVEEVLTEHPDILEAAVVGMPREDGSEIATAALVLRPGAPLDVDSFRTLCQENLARYKVPKRFHSFDELPKNPMGKLQRRLVREQLLAERRD